MFLSVGYGILTAYGVALLFLFLIWLRAPATDESSVMGLVGSIFDPFVLTILIPVGLLVGSVAGGITHFAISGRRYDKAVLTVGGSVAAWIAVATVLSPGVSLAGAIPIFGLALVTARLAPWTRRVLVP